jgi:carboxymethylenebutenolidase
MKLRILVMLALGCVSVGGEALAQPAKNKSKISTEMVTIGTAKCYLARPAGDKAGPALILIHEWWGLNEWVKKQADRFAEQGYTALAVDLYRGEVAKDADHAHELMRGLADDRAVTDLKAAFDWLASSPHTKGHKIGVIGWCMGGGFSLDLGLAEPKIAATVVNYGHLMADPAAVKPLSSPLLGNFGEKDQGIPPKDVEAFEKALKAAGKSSDIKIYPGCGHAFMNPNNTTGYNKAAAEDAWKRIDAFLAKALKLS